MTHRVMTWVLVTQALLVVLTATGSDASPFKLKHPVKTTPVPFTSKRAPATPKDLFSVQKAGGKTATGSSTDKLMSYKSPVPKSSLKGKTATGSSTDKLISYKSPVPKSSLKDRIHFVAFPSDAARNGSTHGKQDHAGSANTIQAGSALARKVAAGKAPGMALAFVPLAINAAAKVRFVRTPCVFVKKRKCCQLATLGSHACSCLQVGKKCFDIKRVKINMILPFETIYPPCPKCYDRCGHNLRICCRLWPCK